jgi:hypothetical protein
LVQYFERDWKRTFNTGSPGVLTIYTENPEVPVGKTNGMCHSDWKVEKSQFVSSQYEVRATQTQAVFTRETQTQAN